LRNGCSAVVISRPTQHNMPMDYRPSHSQIRRILRTSFFIDWFSTVRTIALRRERFFKKKGFVTISLGLIYHSMVLPQLPSRDHWHIVAVTARYANGRCPICHSRGSWRQIVAKSPGFREPVFTSIDLLLYGLSL
jgi:hypothetical protein